jgi:very-short-patch-repair endonuclease
MLRQLAKHLRTNQTDVERLLWHQLRNRGLLGEKFRRQHIISPYIVDFVCFEKKLIVELDGGQHAERQAYDESRTSFLNSQGFRAVRFWNTDVLMNMEGVLQVMSELLRSPSHPGLLSPSPQPSPPLRGGEGANSPSPLAGEGWGEGVRGA